MILSQLPSMLQGIESQTNELGERTLVHVTMAFIALLMKNDQSWPLHFQFELYSWKGRMTQITT